jgi:hypothetical protein
VCARVCVRARASVCACVLACVRACVCVCVCVCKRLGVAAEDVAEVDVEEVPVGAQQHVVQVPVPDPHQVRHLRRVAPSDTWPEPRDHIRYVTCVK